MGIVRPNRIKLIKLTFEVRKVINHNFMVFFLFYRIIIPELVKRAYLYSIIYHFDLYEQIAIRFIYQCQ